MNERGHIWGDPWSVSWVYMKNNTSDLVGKWAIYIWWIVECDRTGIKVS